jgi:hypothetical protein
VAQDRTSDENRGRAAWRRGVCKSQWTRFTAVESKRVDAALLERSSRGVAHAVLGRLVLLALPFEAKARIRLYMWARVISSFVAVSVTFQQLSSSAAPTSPAWKRRVAT